MIRPLLLAAALLAPATLASAGRAQELPPASSAPQASVPPSVGGDAGGPGRYGRMNMSPEMRQARQAMMQACSADFTRLCADAGAGAQNGDPGAGGGRGARMQCLRQHMNEVSDGCRSSMQAMRAARQGGGTPPAASPQG